MRDIDFQADSDGDHRRMREKERKKERKKKKRVKRKIERGQELERDQLVEKER